MGQSLNIMVAGKVEPSESGSNPESDVVSVITPRSVSLCYTHLFIHSLCALCSPCIHIRTDAKGLLQYDYVIIFLLHTVVASCILCRADVGRI